MKRKAIVLFSIAALVLLSAVGLVGLYLRSPYRYLMQKPVLLAVEKADQSWDLSLPAGRYRVRMVPSPQSDWLVSVRSDSGKWDLRDGSRSFVVDPGDKDIHIAVHGLDQHVGKTIEISIKP